MVWPGSSSSWCTIPFQSHQTLSITFLGVNTGLATVCEASPGFDHKLFRTLLSYVIHFSSPVIIRFKNGSISFHFSSESQMEFRTIKFLTVNSWRTQVSSFFWYPVLCKLLKTVLWSIFSSVARSRDEICRSTSIFLRIWSTFSTIGRPGRGPSLTSKFSEQKRANQFWHWPPLSSHHHKHHTIFDETALHFSLFGSKKSKYDEKELLESPYSKRNNFRLSERMTLPLYLECSMDYYLSNAL